MTSEEERELAATILEGTAGFAAGIAAMVPGAGPAVAAIAGAVGAAGGRLIRAFGDDAATLIDKLVAARGAGLITDAQLAEDDVAVNAAIAAMYPSSVVGLGHNVELAHLRAEVARLRALTRETEPPASPYGAGG